ncbi:MAG: YdeI/OmpD-associated family protein [Deltaproteobacteria bacterium]
MPAFVATIRLLGLNPYVAVPTAERRALFRAAGRDKGPIPVRGHIDQAPFRQTFVKYQGKWRLYLNTPLRRAAGKDVGDRVTVELEHDPAPRREPLPAALRQAFTGKPSARAAFGKLPASRQKEICRYINGLKTEQSRARNVQMVLQYLSGETVSKVGAFLRAPQRAKP